MKLLTTSKKTPRTNRITKEEEMTRVAVVVEEAEVMRNVVEGLEMLEVAVQAEVAADAHRSQAAQVIQA
jgi:hypothetical protein